MKHILKKAKITLLLPEGPGGGLTGEAHLATYNGEKYVIRKCQDLKTAKFYEQVSKKLERYGFLPKFLGRYGKDIIYEYIEGRDLRKKERGEIFKQLGRIAAYINKIKVKGNLDKTLSKKLKELVSGKYVPNQKVIMRRKLSNIRAKPKAILSKNEAKQIKTLYNHLKKKVRPSFNFEGVGFEMGNFRLSIRGKIFLVDIEAIRPSIKGVGLAKHFLKWNKISQKRKEFARGYNSISSMKFLTPTYEDFCNLVFIIQALHFKAQVIRDYGKDIKKLHFLFNKYKINSS